MKKLSNVVIILSVAALLTACGDGMITTITTNDLVQPDYNYEIDTWGSNSEVYEFTPKANTDKTCVYVMLDSGRATSMECFDKKSS